MASILADGGLLSDTFASHYGGVPHRAGVRSHVTLRTTAVRPRVTTVASFLADGSLISGTPASHYGGVASHELYGVPLVRAVV